jgi:hypothetical protein
MPVVDKARAAARRSAQDSEEKIARKSNLGHQESCRCPDWVNRVDLAASAVCPVIGPFKSWWFAIEGVGPSVIQAPKLERRIMRTELSDHEWVVIKPMLPNKPRGVPRVNDRRDLNGIFWVLRSGAP